MKCEPRAKPAPKTRRGWNRLFVLSLGLLAAGCGSKGEVSGKVLYQGKPLSKGTVTFVPSSREGAFISRIQQDGSYYMEKVPPGKVKIAVIIPDIRGAGAQSQSSLGAKKGMAQAVKSGKMKLSEEALKKMPDEQKKAFEDATSTEESGQIPAHYSDPEKSGLEYTVTGGSQRHDIELK